MASAPAAARGSHEKAEAGTMSETATRREMEAAMAEIEAEEARKDRAIKDYKLTVEFKHLQQNAPGGVYVVPALGRLRLWHGVIFVRRGLYASGVFKFRLELPEEYNDVDAWPRIFFESPVYSPLVDEETGRVDLKSAYARWDPTKHYVVTALTFLKKIFYLKPTDTLGSSNPAAAAALHADPAEYLRRVKACVENARRTIFDEPSSLRGLRVLEDHVRSNKRKQLSRLLLARADEADDDDGCATPVFASVHTDSPADLVLNFLATCDDDDDFQDDTSLGLDISPNVSPRSPPPPVSSSGGGGPSNNNNNNPNNPAAAPTTTGGGGSSLLDDGGAAT